MEFSQLLSIIFPRDRERWRQRTAQQESVGVKSKQEVWDPRRLRLFGKEENFGNYGTLRAIT